MKKLIYSVLLISIITGLAGCTSYNYYTAGLNRTNLSAYRSFAWMPMQPNAKVNNLVADAKIKDAATAALSNKGLNLQQRNPDLLISYSTTVGRGTRTYYYPNYYAGGIYPSFGFGYGWGSWYRPSYYAFGAPFAYYSGVSVDREHYKEGTLIIDLIDRRSKQVVWRGFGVGEVHKDHQKDIEDLPKVVDGILQQLSLAPSSAPPAGGSGRGAVTSASL
jgi:hypothetical protein